MKPTIAVIGSGVIGLMSGIRLLENGYDVTIFSREHESHMASRGAPAIWIPYKALPEEKVLQWAEYSLNIYKRLSDIDNEKIGVAPIKLVEYHLEDKLPLWTKILKDFTTFNNNLPERTIVGYSTSTLLIDSNVFIDYLINWYKTLNGKMQFANFNKIDDVDKQFRLIVNCSGVWSHQLVPDNETFPIRGQYILTEKIKGIDQITFAMNDENNYTLIVPRIHDCYIGGTTETNDWNTETIESTTNTLFANAKALVPQLKNAEIKKVGVGLRPGRTSVRVEKDLLKDGRTVIHNYGHGGSGFTIGWGSAKDVLWLIQNA